ncbi:single-stranded-DNA-specific exonuclease RecJ [Alistipes putredinis]|uniref:single-stranded-DNA-specific exonuclease RecJ n=1 Tax=Alistipes putredinis TaxID=28117 RepID=UPI00242D528B|nr:single-stranded-DNA-specific exonuclease RecJ [Alistipes putredinis]MBS6651147.1 single-stranded-DNA-specific exonuclease RecJ [Alistipes putredinis]
MPIEKRWVVKPQGNPEAVAAMAAATGISPVLANLLVQRGIDTLEKAKKFFNPQLSDLHDPFLMKDMDKAVERVERAVRNREKIMVYGDYDVDGTTAVALVYKFLRQIGHKDLLFYIPDRYTEGYGISTKGIDHAARKGATLIIALDCGIKAIEKVDYAKRKGVDFIICDHHLPAEEIPRAVAVLDPKRTDCTYPFDELSGCGVGFKLVQAYCQKNGIPFQQIEPLLDLLAVSIASDIVPLVDENRILAHYGLLRLNASPSKGLLSIIKICGLDRHNITIDDIVFKIGPRINAAGRMRMDENDENAAPSGGYAAVNLLIEGNESLAEEFGSVIDGFNQDRKCIDRSVTQEAHDFIEAHAELKAAKSTVIYNPRWMKGIVGIVASRLIETYYRPTVVLTMSNGFVTGSARSVPGFDLYQAIESCSDLLENFGGHMYAAGLTMRPERVEEFTRRFNAYVEENIDPITLQPQVEIDSELFFSNITPAFRRDLNRFQPFGPGNPAPVFVTRGVVSHGETKLVGADCEHLRMDLMQRQKPNTTIQTIAFQQPTHYEWIRAGHPIDVCYQIVENHYRGSVSVQLRIKDIKPLRSKQ